MIYKFLSDLVILLHFGFIVFAVLGALLVMRWPRLVWLHLPAALWAMAIEFYDGICPLTPLENWLRIMAGEGGYSGGFVTHYIVAVIYPDELTTGIRMMLGIGVLIINLALYGWIIKQRRYGRSK